MRRAPFRLYVLLPAGSMSWLGKQGIEFMSVVDAVIFTAAMRGITEKEVQEISENATVRTGVRSPGADAEDDTQVYGERAPDVQRGRLEAQVRGEET